MYEYVEERLQSVIVFCLLEPRVAKTAPNAIGPPGVAIGARRCSHLLGPKTTEVGDG